MRDHNKQKWMKIIENEVAPMLDKGLTVADACRKIGYTRAQLYSMLSELGYKVEFVDMDGNPTSGTKLYKVVREQREKREVFSVVSVRRARIVKLDL